MRDGFASLGSYAGRMRGYLAEMFPLTGHIVFAVLVASGIAGFTRTVQGVPVALNTGVVIGVAWNVFAMLLILRLMDELKDRDIDRRLFPERPLPSGRVRESDIRFTLGTMMVLYLVANVRSQLTLVSSVIVLGYALLMFKRFFIVERLERSLPLTLATHTPIVPLIWLQGFAAAAGSWGIALSDLRWEPIGLYVAMLWLCVLGWEISRKIRAAEEENEYVTYSQILGRTGAVAVAAGLQSVAVLICAALNFRFALGMPYLVLVGAGAAACGWAYVRFLLRPNSRTSKLKPFATGFLFAILLAQLYGFVLARP
jgi:4-hydroxybenzoate polyprenyltransferase